MDSCSLHSQERRLEESLRATESLISDGDDLSVGKLIALLEGRGRGSSLHFLLEVEGNIGELLLDVSDDFSFGGGGEGVASLSEDLHEVVSQVTSSKIESEDGVGKSIAFIDWDAMSDTVTRVHDDSSGSSRSIQRQDSLDGNIHCGGVEGLEHDLSHLFSVGLGVQGGLSQKDWVLLRGHSELVVEGVMPDLLHVVPVGDNSVLNGIFESEDSSLGLSLVSDIRVLLSHTNHHTSVSWSSDD